MRLSRSFSRPASAGSAAIVSSLASLTRSVCATGTVFTGRVVSCHDKRMAPSTSTDAFRAARDLLLAHRADYDAARRSFGWPELDESNWALDWFDVIAAE